MNKPELIDDIQYATGPNRLKNIEQVVDIITTWLDSFPQIENAVALMEEKGIPCAKVRTTAELVDHAQLIARDMIVDLDMPNGMLTKSLKIRGNHLKFSAHKAVLKRPPNLGEHTKEVLLELGYAASEAEAFIQNWQSKQ